jgi:CBS domain-containing protein
MKVKDVMVRTPLYCRLETNLGAASELMWSGNCGFLPIVTDNGKVAGIVTDRDICIALGTRNRLPGDVTVGEVTSSKVLSCSPEGDVHTALQTMKDGRVRRLPVIARDGTLVGVLSMDDVVLHAEPEGLGSRPELSYEDVVKTYRGIAEHRVPEVIHQRGASA